MVKYHQTVFFVSSNEWWVTHITSQRDVCQTCPWMTLYWADINEANSAPNTNDVERIRFPSYSHEKTEGQTGNTVRWGMHLIDMQYLKPHDTHFRGNFILDLPHTYGAEMVHLLILMSSIASNKEWDYIMGNFWQVSPSKVYSWGENKNSRVWVKFWLLMAGHS